MRVAELTLAELDAWVARARGLNTWPGENGDVMYVPSPRLPPRKWSPTRLWSQGGPIIEEAHIDLNWDTEGTQQWSASIEPDVLVDGRSILEAAMRAYVIARFGDHLA
jgi:hypothetical protein